MVMTTIDVIGRYIFNRPLGFAYEVTELLMATVVFVTLAAVTLREEHITIGLFDHFWSARMKAARDVVIGLVIVACTAFLSYRMFLFANRFYEFGDITAMLKFPTYPVAALGAVGIGLAALAGLALTVDALRRMVRGPS
jgi:TRAP-type C4-dicarboxylate transport system permease small subunit